MPRKVIVHIQPYGPGDDRLNGVASRLETLFPTDLELDIKPIRTPAFPEDEAGVATPASLEKAFRRFSAQSRSEPWMYLVCAGSLSGESSTFGATYDAEPGGSFQRRYCAVFWRTIEDIGIDDLLIQTCAHEIGHVLNLGHEDADGSIMVEDPFDGFALRFSDVSKSHLERHDDPFVLPGRAPYGCGVVDLEHPHPERDTLGELAPSRGKLNLDLQVFDGREFTSRPTSLLVGQPLIARGVVYNGRSRRATGLEARARGIVGGSLQIKDRGSWRPLGKAFVSCGAGTAELAQGAKSSFEQLIFQDGGYVFPRAGRFEVRAIVRTKRHPLVSRSREIQVRSPSGAKDQARRQRLLQWELLQALEVGFDLQDRGLARRLSRAVRDFPWTNPIRPWGELVIAREWSRRCLDEGLRRAKREELLDALEKVFKTRSAPPIVRQEALLWRARVAACYGDAEGAKRSLGRSFRLAEPDTWLAARAARQLSRIEGEKGETS